MSGMFNSLILIPIVILMKLFINEVSLLSPRIAQAVSWSTSKEVILAIINVNCNFIYYVVEYTIEKNY